MMGNKSNQLQKFHVPEDGQMRVAGLMSGSGSNLRRIIEGEMRMESSLKKSPYKVVVIFSDNSESNAVSLGKEYDIPVIIRDIRSFYETRGKPRRDMDVRIEYDIETARALSSYDIHVAAYAGYMSIASDFLTNHFLGINVHPADLSIVKNGKRIYTGAHAVQDAILAGEKHLRSTTHIVESKVDYGKILMISPPVEVQKCSDFDPSNKDLVERVSDENQDNLKRSGDWVIFPRTLLYIAQGRYSQDKEGRLYFDGKQIPQGLKIGESGIGKEA